MKLWVVGIVLVERLGREGGGTELCWPRQELMQKLKELATFVSPESRECGWEAAFGRRQRTRNYYSALNHKKMVLHGAASSVLGNSDERLLQLPSTALGKGHSSKLSLSLLKMSLCIGGQASETRTAQISVHRLGEWGSGKTLNPMMCWGQTGMGWNPSSGTL